MFSQITGSLRITLAAATVLGFGSNAAADPFLLPASAFSATAEVVDFTVATTQPLPYSNNGVTFASFSGFLSSVVSGTNFLFMSGPGTLSIVFSEPITMVGFRFVTATAPAQLNTTLFEDPGGASSIGQLALGTFNPGPFIPGQPFVGFGSTSPFTRADISFAVPGTFSSYLIDDFRFDDSAPIPEPGTVSLTLAGLGLLGHRIRRRMRAAKA
jgi:hypothetical protein